MKIHERMDQNLELLLITINYYNLWGMNIHFQAIVCSPWYQRSWTTPTIPIGAAASPPGRCREARKAVKMLSWTTWFEVSEVLAAFADQQIVKLKYAEIIPFPLQRKWHPRFTFPGKSDLAGALVQQVNIKESATHHWLRMRLQVNLDIFGLHYLSMQSYENLKFKGWSKSWGQIWEDWPRPYSHCLDSSRTIVQNNGLPLHHGFAYLIGGIQKTEPQRNFLHCLLS